MKRESGLATVALLLLAMFSLNLFGAGSSIARTPAKPDFAKLKAVSPFEIDLAWRDHSNNEDGFQIERSTDRINFRQIAQVLPGTTIYRDKNLFPGTQYFYRIRAFNASGASRYSITSARTQTPAAPLSLKEWGMFYFGTFAPTNNDLVSVSAGVYHSLGLRKNGKVIAWGGNVFGVASVPTNLTGVVAIAAGQYQSLALKSDGTVVEWGYDGGFLTVPGPPILNSPPPPIRPPRPLPVPPPLPPIVLPIQPIGPIHPIPPVQPILPVQIIPPAQLNPQLQPVSAPHLSTQARLSLRVGLTGVVAISAAPYHSLALKGDGTVVDWGLQFLVPPADLTGVVEIAAGDSHSLALRSDGTVVQWGVLEPPPTNLTSVVAIAAGSGLSMAIKSDGTVVAWGYNSYPTTLATSNLTDVTAIALATYQGVALKKDGSLFVWNLTSPETTPLDLGTGIVAISGGGSDHFLALSTAPTAPSNPSVTILSATQVGFSWTDNSSVEKSFAIERQEQTAGPGDWTPIGTVGPNKTNYVDSTVTTNINYAYRVRAVGKFGDSPYASSLFIMLAPPAPPLALNASLGFSNEVYVQWYDPFSGVDGYKIERAPDDNGQPGTWTEIGSVGNFSPYSFNDLGAAPNHIYWYRVRAFNIFGFSDYSDTFSINVTPPTAPQSLYGRPFADSISLTWSQDELTRGVKIERAPDVNGTPGSWTQIVIHDSTNGLEYSDTGLPLNTTFWYRLRAFNWVGDSAYTDPISVAVLPPAPPDLLYANAGASNGVDIAWYATINDENGFKLERAPDAGGAPGAWSEIASFNDTNADYESYHDTNVVANNTYWYRVRSFNIFGFSDYSTPISVSLVPPPAPTFFDPTTIANAVNLSWQPTAQNLLDFQIERAPDAGGVPGAWTQITILPAYLFSYTDTNLAAGATYWYRIRTANWIGDSPYSSPIVVTIVPPAAPEIDFIVLNPTNGVNLELRDNAGDEVGFLIERAVPTDLGFIDWTQIATVNPVPGATLASFTDTNAVPHATNYYRARTINSVGISDYSATVSIGVTPPAPPYLNTSARADSVSVGIYPNNLTTEAVRGYRLQRAPDAGGHPGAWTPIAIIDATGAYGSYTDSGLAIGPIYWYRAQAFNWVGDSDFSDIDGVMISPPFAPSQLFAWLSVTNNQADLTWYDFSPDEDGFTLERAPDQNGAPGAWSQITTIYATNSVLTEFSDTNVMANTTNWYRVRAFNSASASEYSPVISLAAVAPDPPVLSGNAVVNSANLSWYDSSSSVAGYQLERAPDSNGIPSAWLQITNTTDSQFTDNHLVADTTYWYRVRAYNWVGESDYSDSYGITIVPPGQPRNLFGSVGTNHTVLLQWNDYDQDEDGFKIERVADAGGYPGDNWQEIGSVNAFHADQASFVDTNVTAFTTNWYRVRAFSAAGFSEYDGDAEVRVLPPAPPTTIGASSFRHTIHLDWFGDNYDENIGGFVLQRALDDNGIPGAWTDIATNFGLNQSYADTGLAPNTIYWYRARAFNWVGSSDYASTFNGFISGPENLNFLFSSQGSTNQIILEWYDIATDEDGFRIERAPEVSGLPGNWTQIGVLYTTNGNYHNYYHTFTDTNVTANSTNWYRVQAFNDIGTSDFSIPCRAVAVAPASAPSITGASVIGAHRIDVRWQTDYDFIQGYKIQRAPDNGGAPGAWTLLADMPNTGALGAYSDLAVVMNQQYWYRVQSYNWSGASPYSDPFLVHDAPPPAPALTVTNDQPHQFTVNWAITNIDTTTIKIERAPDNNGIPGTWTQIAEPAAYCGLIPTNYTDIGIPTGGTFWYRVRAVNAVGDSPYSNPANATEGTIIPAISAGPTPPQILSIVPTKGGMLIEWSTTVGNTDVVQASGNFTGGYTNISPAMAIGGSGDSVTNYFDAGALTNGPARFYRIKSSR